MKKITWIVGGAFLLVGAMLFGAYFARPLLASASTSSPSVATSTPTSSTTNPYCTQYLQDLAQRLGVPVSTLQQDSLAAQKDVIAQMAKDGKLTQTQANTIDQNLQSKQACSGKGFLGGPFGGQRGGFGLNMGVFGKYLPTVESQVAKGLNLTSAQLVTDLKNGQSLDQIATAQHVSTTQLNTIVLNAVQSALNQAVKDGNLTQTQANALMQKLQQPAVLQHILSGNSHGPHSWSGSH